MKKIMSLLLTCVVILTCGSVAFAAIPADQSVPSLTEEQIKSFIPDKAEYEVERVALTGKTPAEAVIAYWTFADDAQGTAISNAGTVVLQYKNNNWDKLYAQKDDAFHNMILAKGKLMADGTEQVVLGTQEGSGSCLNYYILGHDTSGNIKVLMSKMGDEDGTVFGGVEIKDGCLKLSSASQGTNYLWNGKDFEKVSEFIANPDTSKINTGDIIIHYAIDENNAITANYANGSTLKFKAGTRIFVIRDNHNGIVERLMYNGDGFIDYDGETGAYKALKAGETDMTIIPDGYDWDKAFTYNITVQ